MASHEKVKKSFEIARPIAGEVLEKFCELLFEEHPEAQDFFKEEKVGVQKEHVLEVVDHIFQDFDKEDEIHDYLKQLGAKHAQWGFLPEHYGWFEESLIKTLSFFFGASWTEELEHGWKEVYGQIQKWFLEGAIFSEIQVEEPIEDSKEENFPEEIVSFNLNAEELQIETKPNGGLHLNKDSEISVLEEKAEVPQDLPAAQSGDEVISIVHDSNKASDFDPHIYIHSKTQELFEKAVDEQWHKWQGEIEGRLKLKIEQLIKEEMQKFFETSKGSAA